MKKLQVLIDDEWKYVFSRTPGLKDPVTTEDPEKAIPAHQHSLQYMKQHFANHQFQYSDEIETIEEYDLSADGEIMRDIE